MDRVALILRHQWIAWWRRLFRSGTAARSNLVVLGIFAVMAFARYFPFLKTITEQNLWYLLASLFFVIGSSCRNDGPISSEALLRFPLSIHERLLIRIGTGIIPPWSLLVLVFAFGTFRPLGVVRGSAFIIVSLAASLIPIPRVHRTPKSRRMDVLRKEVRYILRMGEQPFIVLIVLAFCAYLINGQGLQVDAFRVVLGILAVLSLAAPMNSFGLDLPEGLDRFALFPLTGARIVLTKNKAFFALVAAQRAPIFLLALWRLGAAETLYGMVEAASLALATAAWGNIVSVRHPGPLDAEPLLLDQLVALVAAGLPAAATIGILRNDAAAPVSMLCMLGLCAGLYYASLRYAGPYFSSHFDEIRGQLVR